MPHKQLTVCPATLAGETNRGAQRTVRALGSPLAAVPLGRGTP
jgi:hypothetical protein